MYNSNSNPSYISYHQNSLFQDTLIQPNGLYAYQLMQRKNRAYPQQWNPYIQQSAPPFNPVQGYQPNFNPSNQGYNRPPSYNQSYENNSTPSYSQIVFQNPLFAQDEVQNHSMNSAANHNPYIHPYPKASFLAKQPTGVQNVLNSFKSQDGTLDINKMVDTAGQMLNAVSQVSTVVKGIGGIFKA